MKVQDLIITPIYFLVLFLIAYIIRPLVTTPSSRPYFMPGLMVKFVGAVAIGLIYQFYYSWGDTYTYFREARIIWGIFLNSPLSALRIIFQDTEAVQDLFYFTNRLWTFNSSNNFALIRIVSFLNLFTFNTYSATALLMACFSFGGSWYFYSELSEKYTNLSKSLALSIFFIPSIVVWGSGILKDTMTFGAVMWISGALFHVIENKKISFFAISTSVISVIIIASIKVYILICFVPVVAIWLFSKGAISIKNFGAKLLFVPFLLAFAIAFAYIGAQQAASIDEKYALDNLASTAQVTAYDIAYYSGAGGSTYALGELDGTWSSMLLLTPQAINATLFRPYLWEVNNPLMLLSALESLIFFLLTLRLFIVKNLIKKLTSQPFILFCFSFSIVFAFAVGVSTFNFGTLVRYKIPMMPFYAIFLTILNTNKN